jgi:hypothetical protein
MRGGSCTMTYSNPECQRIILFIDKIKLMERRTVFIDPESIAEEPMFSDKLGDSYFVLGGIPREAIKDYRLIDHSYDLK